MLLEESKQASTDVLPDKSKQANFTTIKKKEKKEKKVTQEEITYFTFITVEKIKNLGLSIPKNDDYGEQKRLCGNIISRDLRECYIIAIQKTNAGFKVNFSYPAERLETLENLNQDFNYETEQVYYNIGHTTFSKFDPTNIPNKKQ